MLKSFQGELSWTSARRREPPFRDLGLQGVIAGAGVSVPQLRKVEPYDVEPLGFLVGAISSFVLGHGAFVGDNRDLPCRATYVLLGTGVEQHGKLSHHNPVANFELRVAGLPGKHLRVALADRVRVVPVASNRGRVTFELGPGLQGLSPQAAR